jgi:hypothetical protein
MPEKGRAATSTAGNGKNRTVWREEINGKGGMFK